MQMELDIIHFIPLCSATNNKHAVPHYDITVPEYTSGLKVKTHKKHE